MTRAGLLLALFAVLTGACKKASEPPAKAPPATITTGTVAPDGVRTIQVTVSDEGYVPDRIPGKPGEKLVLVFTRTTESECAAQLKAPDGRLLELAMNKPVPVPVTVPVDGQVKFACGMEMYTGVVVAAPS